MFSTDATIHPYPAGDTSLRRFAVELKSLGYDSAVATGIGERCEYGGIVFLKGTVVPGASMKEVIAAIREDRGSSDVIMVCAGDAAFNRAVLTYPGVQILKGVHAIHRNGFDHVAARSAADRGVAVDIDLSAMTCLRGVRRQRAMERLTDVVRLSRKYGFALTVSSGAHSLPGLRSTRAASHLLALIGLDAPGVAA
ncbi:MAG TPA: ribonuclease P, partial [Methanoculleus sp.]|nr:ribonuclease P [Methanoculleus sp.]